MPRDTKKDSSDFYNDDLITLEQYTQNSLLRGDNLAKTIFNLKQEEEKLKKAIDWQHVESIEQYTNYLYLLDNLGFEEFVCDKFMQLYNECVTENGLKKDNIEVLLGVANCVILYKIEPYNLEDRDSGYIEQLNNIITETSNLNSVIQNKKNNIEIKDQDLLKAFNNNHKKAEKLLKNLNVAQDNDKNNGSRINDDKIRSKPVRSVKSRPLSNRELKKENQR